ncbi:Replication protein O [Paraburkholderia sp.]|uniref:Replication protein O n=1 Tax=Paraburkholderia sp. TaxID=1926495 RepID=UPI0025E1238D|nr:Replication protein O [Paraburkholderia sp.]
MSIAQRFVAGEGDAHPSKQNAAELNLDRQALSEFTCDTTNLPWVIFRAAFRAEHLSELPARARALLAALARTVDADRPYAAIFARRDLLTGRALQSMRTFYRSLDDLESAGLIHRPPQKRHGEVGLFGRAYLHLTPKSAALLGLVAVEEVEPAASSESPSEEATTVQLDCRSAKVADGAIYKDLSPTAFQKRQPGQLPADLQRLLSLGFRKFLIFKLMREAQHHGKRLSDVVEVAWAHLEVAHAPIAYLRKLLTVPVDFAYQRRTRERDEQQAQAAQRDAEQVQETIARCAGHLFFDAQAQRRLEVSSDRAILTVLDAQEGRPRVSVTGWQAEFVAALESGNVTAATPELTERFEAQRMQAVQGRAAPHAHGRSAVAERIVASPERDTGPRQVTPTAADHLTRLRMMTVAATFSGRGFSGVTP